MLTHHNMWVEDFQMPLFDILDLTRFNPIVKCENARFKLN